MKPFKTSPSLTSLSAPLVQLLAEADRDIRRLEPENPYRLYEFLHATVRRFAPVNAFYVCLYSEPDRALFFAYNAEGEVYDAPVTLPLGNGPTSQAIKQRRPILLNSKAEASALGTIQFGQMEQSTLSQVHVPIHAQPGTDGPIIGVLSAQAYPADAYSPEAVQALQWLADRAGMALARERDDAAWRYRLKAADAQAADRQRPLLAMADEFVFMLQGLSRQAEGLRPLLPPDPDPLLSAALAGLCRDCCAAQTNANQLPLRYGSPSASLLDQLTPSERIVLQHIAAGKPNKVIAYTLGVGEDAVKFHCRNLFGKLGVSSRTAAARLWLSAHPDDIL